MYHCAHLPKINADLFCAPPPCTLTTLTRYRAHDSAFEVIVKYGTRQQNTLTKLQGGGGVQNHNFGELK